jgi:hypothetical protein
MKVGGSGPLNPQEAARRANEAARTARDMAFGEDAASSPAKPHPYQPGGFTPETAQQHWLTHKGSNAPPKPQASSGEITSILKNRCERSKPSNTSDFIALTQENTSQNAKSGQKHQPPIRPRRR